MSDLSQRVVLITGASGALGRAVVNSFLTSCAAVIGVCRNPAPDEVANLFWVKADLISSADAHRAVSQAWEIARRLDAVVHLMGGFAGGSQVHETDDAVWNQMIDINLRAAFHVFRAALPYLLEQGHGRIIAVGSRAGEQPAAGLAAYGVAKAGLHALVRTIALETKDHGITANVVMPSVIDTEANRAGGVPPAQAAKWVKPSSIAEMILWLASDAAADVTGALIPIYGRV